MGDKVADKLVMELNNMLEGVSGEKGVGETGNVKVGAKY